MCSSITNTFMLLTCTTDQDNSTNVICVSVVNMDFLFSAAVQVALEKCFNVFNDVPFDKS